VVKKIGIAKGSVYQYFEDKLDLFQYLIAEAVKVKMSYIAHINRDDFDSFWTYFRKLYEDGCHFDRDHPIESAFLHHLAENLKSPSVAHLYDEMLQQTLAGFEVMVKKEQALGLFKTERSVKAMALTLYKTGMNIIEQLRLEGVIDTQKSIKNKQPVFDNKEDKLLAVVDEYIELIKPAFNAN
jgi:AcrR family transcriptional regulator